MTLLWFGGFDAISTANMDGLINNKEYLPNLSGFAGMAAAVGTYAATGVNSFRVGSFTDWGVTMGCGGGAATIVLGCAMLHSIEPIDDYPLYEFKDDSNNIHCKVYIGTSGGIWTWYLKDSVGTTTLATSSSVRMSSLVWYFFEIKINIHASTGSCIMKVNGIEIMNATGLDTYNTGTVGIERIKLGGGTLDMYVYRDDLYILDTNGSAPCNDLIGPVKVETLMPNADGNSIDWTALAGDRYAAVDESSGADNDTTYIYSGIATDKNSTGFPDVSITTTIFAIAHRYYMRYFDYTAVEINGFLRVNSTDYVNSTDHEISGVYQYYVDYYEENPDDSNPWEDADIDALEAGVKIKTITA